MKIEKIEAFGLITRTDPPLVSGWLFENKGAMRACLECCTGDRCDSDCIAVYKGRRKECPHCKGKGWIKPEDVVRVISD